MKKSNYAIILLIIITLSFISCSKDKDAKTYPKVYDKFLNIEIKIIE